MAGKWDLSGTQVFNLAGTPEVGARAYFFAAGTTTPLTTYTDYTLADPNPAFIETDGYGRWPIVYFDDGDNSFYRVRATDEGGSVIYFDFDTVPIIGPGEGGGGEVTPVDQDGLLKTGDCKVRYGTGTKSGFVRLNGRTMGSATSGAAERASADTQSLFEYLYNTDANLTVSGGRGSSATADFEANKTITLPDGRGKLLAMLDDMGNSAAGVITGLTTLGEVMGSEDVTLVAGQIPQLTVSGTTSTAGAHTHGVPVRNGEGGAVPRDGGSSASTTSAQTTSAGDHNHTFTTTTGSASPSAVPTLPPLMGFTVYIKL